MLATQHGKARLPGRKNLATRRYNYNGPSAKTLTP